MNRSAGIQFTCIGATLLVCLVTAPTAGAQGGAARKLITGLTVAKDALCPGEILEVNAAALPGVVVTINGVVGERGYVQFFGKPGDRIVYARAVSTIKGETDFSSRKVTVRDCPGFPSLEVTTRPNPYHNMRLDFRVIQHNVPRDQTTYAWDFGDGARLTTTIPYASHDYSKRMNFQRPYNTWHVSVSSPSSRALGKKSVAIPSMYFFAKQRGVLRPPTESGKRLEQAGRRLTGQYLIRNVEREPITFDTATLEYQPCDPNARSRFVSSSPRSVIVPKGGLAKWSALSTPGTRSISPGPIRPGTKTSPTPAGTKTVTTTGTKAPPGPAATPAESGPFTIGPLQDLNGFVNIDEASVPKDVCGIAYHFRGKSPSGLKARTSVYFEARDNPRTRRAVRDTKTLNFLRDLAKAGLLRKAAEVTHEDLYRWSQEGRVRRAKDGSWEVVR